jgi:hypothetical protein
MTVTETHGLYERLVRHVGAARLATGPDARAPVSEADLPDVVRRYLRFMGTVGWPRIWSFHANIAGRFLMRLRVAHVLPLLSRDTYEHGLGPMVGTLLNRFTSVQDWTDFDGRTPPTHIQAVWHLQDGPMPHFTGRVVHLTRDVRIL